MTDRMRPPHAAPGRAWLVLGAAGCAVGLMALVPLLRAPSTARVGEFHGAHVTDATDGVSSGARRARTNFGWLEAHRPTLVHGMSAGDLAGNVHGIGDYVPPHRQLVQVPVTLANDSANDVGYDIRRFTLAARRGSSSLDHAVHDAASSTVGHGRLAPGTTVSGIVTFVAPRDGARLFLRVEEVEGVHRRIPIGTAGPVHRPATGDRVGHLDHPTSTPHGAHHAHAR